MQMSNIADRCRRDDYGKDAADVGTEQGVSIWGWRARIQLTFAAVVLIHQYVPRR
jgi:hypothetical protein